MIDDDDQDDSDRRTAPTRSPRRRARSPDGVPAIGEIVDGKYRIERVLGAGGMGVVVAAMHLELGERVALKFVKLTEPDADVVERLKREARITFRLRSKHTARLLDVGTLGSGAPFLVLEYLAGDDLARVLEERGAFSIADAVDCVIQASVAIAEAHRLGIVHRDLKPSNLFLTRDSDGRSLLKVLDFGVAKALGQLSGAGDAITTTTAVVGSPLYMSPEQVRGARNLDGRSDIWSLGVILHELLTAAPPFAVGPASAVCAAIAADEPEKLRVRRPEAPAALESLISKCLEKDPSKRFQSVGSFATALARFSREASAVSLRHITSLAREPALSDSLDAIERDAFGEDRGTAAINGSPRSKARVSAAGIVVALALVGLTIARVRGSSDRVGEVEARNFSTSALAITRPFRAFPTPAEAITLTPEPSASASSAAASSHLQKREKSSPTPARGAVKQSPVANRSSTPSATPDAAPTPPPREPTADELELRATSRRH